MPLRDEPSLLERFDLRVEQLDYSFVRDCDDKRTLERIIRVLRSGEEGSYPHLLRYTEDRLALVCPESRLLIVDKKPTISRDLPDHQRSALEEELKQWSSDMKEKEEELTRFEVIRAPHPPVRNAKKKDLLAAATEQEATQTHMSKEEKEDLVNLGHKYRQDGNFLQASLQFQKVLSFEPFNPEALKGMAAIHDRSKSGVISNGGGGGRGGGGVVIEEIL